MQLFIFQLAKMYLYHSAQTRSSHPSIIVHYTTYIYLQLPLLAGSHNYPASHARLQHDAHVACFAAASSEVVVLRWWQQCVFCGQHDAHPDIGLELHLRSAVSAQWHQLPDQIVRSGWRTRTNTPSASNPDGKSPLSIVREDLDMVETWTLSQARWFSTICPYSSCILARNTAWALKHKSKYIAIIFFFLRLCVHIICGGFI